MPRVLYLTGQNNHDWRRTSVICAGLLRDRLGYDVVIDHEAEKALCGDLSGYDLIFLDYNGPTWNDQARAAFEAAIAGGCGLVSLHASNNAHTGWVAFERMVVPLWRETGNHGDFHEYEVTIDDPDHPITRGMAAFRTWDELYHAQQNPQDAPVHVLASAYSDPATRGSGKVEPMATVTQYGEGRIFHLLLGHVWTGNPASHNGNSTIALESDGFRALLLRGSEWATTGTVSAT